MIFFCKVLQRLGVCEVLVLHDEIDRVANLSAAEAFEDLLRRRYGERRSLLVMKRAKTDIIRTSPFQHNKFSDHFFNVAGR